MKQAIHPDYIDAKVICNGCGTKFDTRASVPKIEVEICSQCHPFYTGKQKLVDVAGRVDRFRARQASAGQTKIKDDKKAPTADKKSPAKKELKDLKELKA